jgi:beta-glucosidase
VEGGNHNDWTQWEQRDADLLVKAASDFRYSLGKRKGLPPEAFTRQNYISGLATDHYRRYEEDLDIAQKLGLDVFSFSIEWSRIEPQCGHYDKEQIAHYRRVAEAAAKRGMQPFVTLWHWTLPLWAAPLGWESDEVVDRFEAFATLMSHELGDIVSHWTTINEPTIYAFLVHAPAFLLPLDGRWLNYRRGFRSYFHVRRQLVQAHKRAYRAIKQVQSHAQVGIRLSYNYYDGWYDPVSLLVRSIRKYVTNGYFARQVVSEVDWLGLQYYVHVRVRIVPYVRADSQKTDLDYELFPKGHYWLLKELARFGKPLYVSESGLADRRDRYRADYIQASLNSIAMATREGVDCRGYNYWSLLDNFEWAQGFWPRFGLVAVDYGHNRQRTIRPSALAYRDYIKEYQRKQKAE